MMRSQLLASLSFSVVLSIALATHAKAQAPSNDDCANATTVGYGLFSFDTTHATTDSPDLTGWCHVTSSDNQNYNDVWFRFTPQTGGCPYVSTLGLAGFDTKISIFLDGQCPPLASDIVVCSDNEVQNPQVPPFEAGIDASLTGGETYLICVGSASPAVQGGPGMLRIDPDPQAFMNDMGMQTGGSCIVDFVFVSHCRGDGGDQMGCTDCPCSNNAVMGTIGGCLNSSGNASQLGASGSTSVSLPAGDLSDLRISLSGTPANALCVLMSGGGVAPLNMANPCFGLGTGLQAADRDGLRCVVGGPGQSVLRHGGRQSNFSGEVMDSSGPSRVWGGEAQPNAGIAGQAGFAAGQLRYFQVTHRDDALQVCMRGLNTSQALEVTFTP